MESKTRYLILAALIFQLQYLSGQAALLIPYSGAPTVDGAIIPGEWDNAGMVEIPILNGLKKVRVRFMHDSANLHIAFLGNLESSNVRFPEVLLDINRDKSNTWLADDWWFHVSATDCEYQGQYANYVNCEIERPNWEAEQNFSPGLPKTDTVEIRIPFSTIGIAMNSTDTIGIAFLLTNTATVWEYWPGSADKNMPFTWGDAVFDGNNATITSSPSAQERATVFPNPTKGKVYVPAGTYVEVFDFTGRSVLKKSDTDCFDIGDLPSGIYVLRTSDAILQTFDIQFIVKE